MRARTTCWGVSCSSPIAKRLSPVVSSKIQRKRRDGQRENVQRCRRVASPSPYFFPCRQVPHSSPSSHINHHRSPSRRSLRCLRPPRHSVPVGTPLSFHTPDMTVQASIPPKHPRKLQSSKVVLMAARDPNYEVHDERRPPAQGTPSPGINHR